MKGWGCYQDPETNYVWYILNSLKGVIVGDYTGEYYGGY